MRLYNPHSGVEFETASDDDLHVQVYLDAGYLPAPEPEVKPGYEPEPVVYAPVVSKAKRGSKTESVKGEESTD